MAASLPRVGTRIFLSGHIGTIKFVGPVHGTPGTWLGVEWDDPQRGKHDGTKDAVQYFTCTWVVCGPVARVCLTALAFVLTGSQRQEHSFGRHPLSNTGQPSHELFFRNTWRISMDPKDRNLSSSVLPTERLRSRPLISIRSETNSPIWRNSARSVSMGRTWLQRAPLVKSEELAQVCGFRDRILFGSIVYTRFQPSAGST